jgi:transcriptional regulator with XRE-family HTH domain
MHLTGSQLRAARALLGWSAQDLADRSKVGVSTIRRTEVDDGPVRMIQATTDAIIRALEAGGVQLIAENGGGAGVRLARGTQAQPAPGAPRE